MLRQRDLHFWPSAVCLRNATLVAEMKAKNMINVLGFWIHGGRLRPFKRSELHRIELADIDHVSDGRKEIVHSEKVEINAARKLVKAVEDGL